MAKPRRTSIIMLPWYVSWIFTWPRDCRSLSSQAVDFWELQPTSMSRKFLLLVLICLVRFSTLYTVRTQVLPSPSGRGTFRKFPTTLNWRQTQCPSMETMMMVSQGLQHRAHGSCSSLWSTHCVALCISCRGRIVKWLLRRKENLCCLQSRIKTVRTLPLSRPAMNPLPPIMKMEATTTQQNYLSGW